MKLYSKVLILFFTLFVIEIAKAQTFPNNIPAGRPRIWWNSQKMTQAQQWFTTHPFTPNSSTDPVNSNSDPTGNALKYLLTGDATYARVAINWAMNAIATMPTSGLTCDQCRWYGEEALIAFDWCNSQMTATEKSNFTSKMNQVVTAFNATSWGNNNPESNYFWGYQRLSLLWGIASYWEQTSTATPFINNAITTKWDNMFIPYATNEAPGGIPAEGVDYGYTVETYPVVPLETMKVYGRDMFEETNYWKRSVFNNIYSLLPGLTFDNPGRSTAGKTWFPFGDSGDFLGASDPILRSGSKDFMKYAATRWNNIKIGQYARKWISTLGSTFPKLYDALDPGGVEADFSSLPLDYFSTGIEGHAFLKTSWGTQGTVVHLQIASAPVIGHEHFDTGNWQIWRNQRFLSRESPGRGQGSGYSYTGYNNVGRADADQSVNHNVLLFGGKGHASGSDIPSGIGTAQVLRMETNPNYFYSAADITPSYKNSTDPTNASWNNLNVQHAEREFIFIRPLEALFIFDRMQSDPTKNTSKTFLAHFQSQPTQAGNQTLVYTNGTQGFLLQTLLPASPGRYQVIDEQSSKVSETGSPFRLEVEQSGTGIQYFMHIAQARDASAQNLTASVVDNGSTYTVTISHPTKGGAKIILNKGLNTSGGSFGYSTSGVPSTTSPLRTDVQGISITNNGPVWSGTTSCSYTISPTSISPSASATTGTVTVTTTTGCGWTAVSNQPWITVTSGASGTGNGTVGYSVAANTGAARSGSITIAGQNFTVNQGASACSATLSPTSVSPGAGASTGSVSVTIGAGCTWTATSNSSWLTVTSGASGTGNGTVGYSVAANGGGARTGNLTVAGQTFTVNQAAASGCSTTPTSGNWINAAFTAQTGTFTVNFDVTPSLSNMDGVVGISNGAKTAYSGFACILQADASGVFKARNGGAYAATTNVPYTGGNIYHVREVINVTAHTYSVFVTPPGGSELTLASNFAFRTEQNTVTQLNNWGAVADPAISVGTLTICNFSVGGATCTYSINPTSASPSAAATTGSVSVTAGTGCSWTATSNDSWLTITSGSSGSGNGTVNYSVAANTGVARTGTLTIATKTFTVTQGAGTSSLVDFYVNETTSSFSFTGGTVGVTATVAAEGLGNSNCLKFSTFPDQWAKTPRVQYPTAKNISTVLSTDVLRISIDMMPGSPPNTYLTVVFNDQWNVSVNTPVIDNVAGFQTFDISLSAVRSLLGNTVNNIYFQAGDGFPSGAVLKVDEIRFIRPANGGRLKTSPADIIESEEEPGFEDKVAIYPNPADDEVTITLQEPVRYPTEFKVVNMLGEAVVESTLNAGTQSHIINVQKFKSGTYILRVHLPEGLVTRKILIVHK